MNVADSVSDYVGRKIHLLENGSPSSKAMMASLRKCAGKDIRDSPDSWEITLSGLPEQMEGKALPDGLAPSVAENAVHVTLTLFAVHMQSRDMTANSPNRSFASAIRSMMNESNKEGVKRRFDSMVTSTDLSELAYHARSLIQLLRSTTDLGFDYQGLARDLYFYQFPDGKRNTLMRWGQDFYGKPFENDNKEE